MNNGTKPTQPAFDLTKEIGEIMLAAANYRANALKTYTVTFSPNGTAPAGNLGKPDFFGFKVEAASAAGAIDAARIVFDKTFPELSGHYTASDIEA